MADKNNEQDKKLEMSLDEYILNPMGKHNAVLNGAMRELMRKTYMKKFDNLMIREHGKMDYNLYIDNAKNEYWAHIKVPSETVEKFYYDIVFKFYIDASKGGTNDLFKWNVKFYSNDPSFVYTYAYVFNNRNLFIPELKTKMSTIAIKDAPKEKNPDETVGYVKTIYFAYLLMQNRKLNKLIRFEAEAQPLSPQKLLSEVMPADEKINLRQEEGKGVSKRKKKEVSGDILRKIKKNVGSDGNLSGLQVRTTKKVNKIKMGNNTVKTVKAIKKSKKK